MAVASASTPIFDRTAVRRHRDRAARLVHAVAPVLNELAARLLDRLDDTRRHFTDALEIGGRGAVAPRLAARGLRVISLDMAPRMAAVAGGTAVTGEETALPFRNASFDLVMASLCLHWIDDLPGALKECRRVLRPDGLFLADMPLLGATSALRAALAETEAALRGGAAPRTSPLPTLADAAALLQGAGFVVPVADRDELRLSYATAAGLLRDLRAAGETNALAARDRRPPPRALFALPSLDRELLVPIAVLTGWAPALVAKPRAPSASPLTSAT